MHSIWINFRCKQNMTKHIRRGLLDDCTEVDSFFRYFFHFVNLCVLSLQFKGCLMCRTSPTVLKLTRSRCFCLGLKKCKFGYDSQINFVSVIFLEMILVTYRPSMLSMSVIRECMYHVCATTPTGIYRNFAYVTDVILSLFFFFCFLFFLFFYCSVNILILIYSFTD